MKAVKLGAVCAGLAASLAFSGPAAAREIYLGAYDHEADLPWSTNRTGESGVDLQAGYRFASVDGLLGAAPYVFASVNSQGDTDFAGAGLSWKLEQGRVFIRPGIGIVVHDGPSYRLEAGVRTDLGSRVLFEPGLAIGLRLSGRVDAELSWVHTSHAKLFGSNNPGLDLLGLRLNWRLGER